MESRMLSKIKSQSGQGLTEYLILLLLISIVSIAAAKSLGGIIKLKLQEARNHINKDVTLESNSGGWGGLLHE